MSIWLSYDDGATWPTRKVVFFGYAGYADMTVVGPDTILLAYNRGRTGGQFIPGGPHSPRYFDETALARINLRWLESAEPYQFTYFFNEKSPGEPANTTGSDVSLTKGTTK